MASIRSKQSLTTKMGHRRVRRGNATDAEALKLILVEAAHRLFKEGGLTALTMRNLAAKAQVSAMTPYTYFKNKSDILWHIKDDIVQEMLNLNLQSVKGATSARDAMRRSTLSMLHFLIDRPDKFRLMFYPDDYDSGEPLAWGGAAALSTLDLREFDKTLVFAWANEIAGNPDGARIATTYRYATIIGFTQLSLLNMRSMSNSEESMNAITEVMLDAIEMMLLKKPNLDELAAVFPTNTMQTMDKEDGEEKPNTSVGLEGLDMSTPGGQQF